MTGLQVNAGRLATIGGQDYAWTGSGWRHVACGGHVGFADDALDTHKCTFTCPDCKGRGEIPTGRDYFGQGLAATCGMCGGSGDVSPQTLAWARAREAS